MFDYESEDQSSELSQESQLKVKFFLLLVDHATASLNDRFEQTHFVTEIFNFLLSQENLLQAFNENNILDACKEGRSQKEIEKAAKFCNFKCGVIYL